MKMMIFTAKHHDGFCGWHTQTTDFSAQNSPVKEDIMSSLRSGCDANGIELGVYLSPQGICIREKTNCGAPSNTTNIFCGSCENC